MLARSKIQWRGVPRLFPIPRLCLRQGFVCELLERKRRIGRKQRIGNGIQRFQLQKRLCLRTKGMV